MNRLLGPLPFILLLIPVSANAQIVVGEDRDADQRKNTHVFCSLTVSEPGHLSFFVTGVSAIGPYPTNANAWDWYLKSYRPALQEAFVAYLRQSHTILNVQYINCLEKTSAYNAKEDLSSWLYNNKSETGTGWVFRYGGDPAIAATPTQPAQPARPPERQPEPSTASNDAASSLKNRMSQIKQQPPPIPLAAPVANRTIEQILKARGCTAKAVPIMWYTTYEEWRATGVVEKPSPNGGTYIRWSCPHVATPASAQ